MSFIRNKRTVYSFLCIILLAVFLSPTPYFQMFAAEVPVAVSISQTNIVIKPNQKYTLTVTAPEQSTITWRVKDSTIAKVSKTGKVTGLKEGKTYIYAKVSIPATPNVQADNVASKKKATTSTLKCKVTVEAVKTVSIAAVGDALLHENILNSGKKSDGTYNYNRLFSDTKDYLKPFDVKIINQETIFINDSNKYGGYPSFGSPTALGDAMRKYGFNVITCATNHAYDRGKTGIQDTIDYWDQYKETVLMTGIYNSQKAYDTIPIREYNGIKIAFLNYTSFVNSGSKRDSFAIRTYNAQNAVNEIKAAKKAADFVIVLPHWGEEYTHTPNKTQTEMAQKFADAGADLIIGCHPHVVQPLKIIKASDGRNVPCYYSLGNFFSNMFWMKCQLEGLAEVQISKWNGETKITKAVFTPLVNHMNKTDTQFRVYLLKDYKDDKYKEHYMNHRYWMGLVTYDRLLALFNSIGNEKWKP